MLDLSAVKKVYYEIKLQDGTELKIGKPTQSMVEYCINAMNAVKEEVDIEAIHALATLFVKILNRNNEGLKFKEEDIIEEYDYQLIAYVIKDYFDFWNLETNKQVVFQVSQ
jgi:hypothetical protein